MFQYAYPCTFPLAKYEKKISESKLGLVEQGYTKLDFKYGINVWVEFKFTKWMSKQIDEFGSAFFILKLKKKNSIPRRSDVVAYFNSSKTHLSSYK